MNWRQSQGYWSGMPISGKIRDVASVLAALCLIASLTIAGLLIRNDVSYTSYVYFSMIGAFAFIAVAIGASYFAHRTIGRRDDF